MADRAQSSCCELAEGCFVSCNSHYMVFPPGLAAQRQTKARPTCSCTTCYSPNNWKRTHSWQGLWQPSVCPPAITTTPNYSEARLPRKEKHAKTAPLGGFPCVAICESMITDESRHCFNPRPPPGPRRDSRIHQQSRSY